MERETLANDAAATIAHLIAKTMLDTDKRWRTSLENFPSYLSLTDRDREAVQENLRQYHQTFKIEVFHKLTGWGEPSFLRPVRKQWSWDEMKGIRQITDLFSAIVERWIFPFPIEGVIIIAEGPSSNFTFEIPRIEGSNLTVRFDQRTQSGGMMSFGHFDYVGDYSYRSISRLVID